MSTSNNLLNVVLSAVIVMIAVYTLVVGRAILMPLVLSFIIAYLISALTNSFQMIPAIGKNIPHWLAFSLSLLSVALVLMLLSNLIISNVEQVIERAPEYQASLEIVIAQLTTLLGVSEIPTLNQMIASIDFTSVAQFLLSPLTTVASNTFIVIFYVSFILLERKSLRNKLQALIPDVERERTVEDTIASIELRIRKYVSIKIFVSLIVGSVSYLVMRTLEIDFAAFWAVLIFLLNFIPYIGSIIAVTFPVMLSLLQFQSISIFLLTLGLLMAVQISVGNLLEPRIMGQSLNLSPLVIMLALAIWGSVWGIVGMIICIPMMVIAMIIFTQFPRTRPIAIIMSQNGDIDPI